MSRCWNSPRQAEALGDRHRHAERAALPRRSKTSSPLRRGSAAAPASPATSGPASHRHASRDVPIIASRVTSAASSSSPSARAGRTLGKDEVADLGARVPHPDLDVVRHVEPISAQQRPRLAHHARAVRRALVPGRRQPEHRPRVAGAQRAHHDVVHVGRVLDHDHVLALRAAEAQLGDRRGAVVEQARLVLGSTQARATTRAPFIGPMSCSYWLDDGVENAGADEALLDQQRPRARAHAPRPAEGGTG